MHNDYSYFLKPVDNFFETGLYSYDGKTAFGGRMPGYWVIYFLLRLVFAKENSLIILIALQVFTSIAASLVIGKLASSIVKRDKRKWFYTTGVLFAISPFLVPFEIQTISESFSISAFVFFLYFFTSYLTSRQAVHRNLFLSGFFLAWAIFLRPYLGLIWVILVLYLIYGHWQKSNYFKLAVTILIFSSSFLLFETCWVIRNYVTFNQFIPLTTNTSQYGKAYSKSWLKARSFLYRLGEDGAYFQPGLAHWVRRDSSLQITPKVKKVISETAITENELIKLKLLYQKDLNSNSTSDEEELLDFINYLTLKLKRENPFRYYVLAPLKAFARLFMNSGSQYFPFPIQTLGDKPFKIFKAFALLFYLGVLTLGSIYLLVFRNMLSNLLLLICCAILCVLIFYSATQEARYLVHIYCILLLSAVMVLDKILDQNIWTIKFN